MTEGKKDTLSDNNMTEMQKQCKCYKITREKQKHEKGSKELNKIVSKKGQSYALKKRKVTKIDKINKSVAKI